MSLPNLLKIIQNGFNRKLTHKIIKVLKLTRQFDDYDKKKIGLIITIYFLILLHKRKLTSHYIYMDLYFLNKHNIFRTT